MRDPGFAPQVHHSEQLPNGEWLLENRTEFQTPFKTTSDPIFHWAAQAPSRPWMAERGDDGWAVTTYADAADDVLRIAAGLVAMGLRCGEVVLVVARNGVDNALLTYGAHLAGLSVAVVSPRYIAAGADHRRLESVVKLTAPAAVFVDSPLVARRLEACLPDLRKKPTILPRTSTEGGFRIDELRGSSPVAQCTSASSGGRLILMTSGSTGAARAVVCAQETMVMNAAQTAACYADTDPPVVVNAAPWSHALGSLSIRQHVLHRGGSLYIDHGEPTISGIAITIANLREISPTYHHMVPSGWALLADALETNQELADTFFRRLRVAAYGGAGLAQSVADRVQALAEATIGEQISWTAGYGCTESGPVVCNVHWPNASAKLIGFPVPGTRIKLARRAGKLEICASGPQLNPGYLAPADSLVPLALDAEGYYAMGDAARPMITEERLALEFDGRLVENFKLATGTFVSAGNLRMAALSAIGSIAFDCIVCGEGKDSVGLLVFLDHDACRSLAGVASNLRGYADACVVRDAVRRGLRSLNAQARGSASRVGRVMLMGFPPDRLAGELTEKGTLNQLLCRERYADYIHRLYSAESEDVIEIDEARAHQPDDPALGR